MVWVLIFPEFNGYYRPCIQKYEDSQSQAVGELLEEQP